MKTFILILALAISASMNAQSIIGSKVFKYLQIQNQKEISKDVIDAGFQFDGKETNYNMTLYSYHKKGTYGLEKFSFGYSDELFSVIYKPVNEFYSVIKDKIFSTGNLIYTYSHRNTKYYESNNMRIGFNDANNIISFFVKLK